MSISETAPVTHMPDNSAQDYGHGPSRLNIFGKYDDFVANEKMLDGLSSAYIRSFNREPWNELYTPDQVKGKLERQLTIPGTNPIIVTLENAGRFGFAWGCDGPADVIIPEAVENDFPDLSLGMKEQVGALLVKKASQVTPDGQIFWAVN